MEKAKYDFSGWATRINLKCSDGRTIRDGAFKENDGKVVPLVWNHDHNDPNNVLGHALLEYRPKQGMYTYCTFNESENGQNCKHLVEHGDIVGLSIWANQLKQSGGDVMHGNIREVSLVLSGANPGAFIDTVSMAHGDDSEQEEAVIYTGEELELVHADEESKEEKKMADEEKKEEKEKTVKDVWETLNEEQKTVVYALIGQAMEDAKSGKEEDEGEKEMKHNVFDGEEKTARKNVLSHADQEEILQLAKANNVGSFKTALSIFAEENGLELMHADDDPAPVSGFVQDPDVYGNVSYLFPEYKDVRPGAPELLTNDQGWISVVMRKLHKSPISRIRTQYVDIRNIDKAMDDLRARGYVKGNKKSITGNFKLARRETDPQTIYVKSELHRDDIIDITDFDYVQYLYNIDRMNLNEEIATAVMFGDGREDGDPDRIDPSHIRPIWTDDDLYTIHVDVEDDTEIQGSNTEGYFGENYRKAESMVNTLLYAREKYKGTGTPDMFITPHMLNVMLLARDMNGRRIYSSKSELAAALNVGDIYTVEQMEGKTRENSDQETKKLLALVVNLNDYYVGSTKGGEITHFTQFDIDFNKQKSLLETRISGAMTKVYAAIAVEETVNP